MLTENVNIAILGPVSAGKSTFVNSIFCDTMSEMKRKRTTMLPQIYQVTHDKKSVNSTKMIIERNTTSNELIYEKRQNNTFNVKTDFNEIVHFVRPMDDFLTLPGEHNTYSILDMPGLNDQFSDIYYDYIRQKSKYIDIYLVIYDVNSSLNTTDEVKILQFVVDQVKKNKSGYIYVIINKCNDFEFTNNGFKIPDSELRELYQQATNTVKEICKDVAYTISPMCTNDLYVYRSLAYNKTCEISENDLDRIIKEEAGKSELKKFKTYEQKRKCIQGKISANKKIYDSGITDSGYKFFKTNLQKIINEYFETFVNTHVDLTVDEYVKKLDFNKFDKMFVMNVCKFFVDVIERLKAVQIKKVLYIKVNPSEIINKYVLAHLNSYTDNMCDDNAEAIRYFNIVLSQHCHCNEDLLNVSIVAIQNEKIKILKKYINDAYDLKNIKLLWSLDKLTLDDYRVSVNKKLNWWSDIAVVDLTSDVFVVLLENCKNVILDALSFLSTQSDECSSFVETIIKSTYAGITEKLQYIWAFNTNDNNIIKNFILFDERCNVFVDLLNIFSGSKNSKIKYLIYLLTNTIKNKTAYLKYTKTGYLYNINMYQSYISSTEYEMLHDSTKSFVDFLDETFGSKKTTTDKTPKKEESNELSTNASDCESKKSDTCDDSNTGSSDEEYLTDDEPEVIYTKAVSNANKKTKKILSCVKND